MNSILLLCDNVQVAIFNGGAYCKYACMYVCVCFSDGYLIVSLGCVCVWMLMCVRVRMQMYVCECEHTVYCIMCMNPNVCMCVSNTHVNMRIYACVCVCICECLLWICGIRFCSQPGKRHLLSINKLDNPSECVVPKATKSKYYCQNYGWRLQVCIDPTTRKPMCTSPMMWSATELGLHTQTVFLCSLPLWIKYGGSDDRAHLEDNTLIRLFLWKWEAWVWWCSVMAINEWAILG